MKLDLASSDSESAQSISTVLARDGIFLPASYNYGLTIANVFSLSTNRMQKSIVILR